MLAQLIDSRESTLRRIRAEYREMPGLALTPAQARRLWGLDPTACDALLTDLVRTGFLAYTRGGSLVLRDRSSVRGRC
jgi:hypothetical protein